MRMLPWGKKSKLLDMDKKLWVSDIWTMRTDGGKNPEPEDLPEVAKLGLRGSSILLLDALRTGVIPPEGEGGGLTLKLSPRESLIPLNTLIMQ
jgi:hypothetical protein